MTDTNTIKFKHDRFNSKLVRVAKKYSGNWNSQEKCWVFNKMLAPEIKELEKLYNSNELVVVQIELKEDTYKSRKPIEFLGYTLARAFDRDGGARVGDGVALINGEISSGGSANYWTTTAEKGTTFRLEVPKTMLEKYRKSEEKYFEITVVNEETEAPKNTDIKFTDEEIKDMIICLECSLEDIHADNPETLKAIERIFDELKEYVMPITLDELNLDFGD